MIAITATFTAEAVEPALTFWNDLLGLGTEIRFGGYNQIFQQLLDPAGLFARNRGFNVALVRLEDWIQAGAAEQAKRFVDAVRSLSGAPLIVAVCPSSPEYERYLAAIECDLSAALSRLPGVYPITPADVSALYPVAEVHDPHANELGHLPYTPLYFVSLATAIARKIHAVAMPPFKVIALDCDDTIWSGICGEDGPEGVVLDPSRRCLQEFFACRRRDGMLLALCSKNNEADVFDTFLAHPEMPLKLSDFVAHRINWNSKGVNLAEIAEELDLGLDSFILVDDNLKECDEAQAAVPEALSLPLPSDPSQIPAFLSHVWAFDRARITEEDRRRPELYAQRAERTRAERAADSLEEFVASLDLKVTIAPAKASQIPRISQLTQRTNQMNATLVRRSEAELQSLKAEILAVEVSDRFGSYGLCGALIFRCNTDALVVDTFLLSCRALGRSVEHRMLSYLGALAQQRGLAHIEIPFVGGPRNRPAALFLESLAAPEPGGIFRIPAAPEYRAPRMQPAAQTRKTANEEREPDRSSARRRPPYLRIASTLRTPEAILAEIRASSPNASSGRAKADPPRTPLERDLAELWGSLLNLPGVGVHDNFFELGGHSLLAVQLLSRVRQIHGVELSLEVVYSGEFTVAELAKAVELKEIEQAGGDYHDLLQELEALSDDEVRSLLAEEQDAE